MFLTELTMNYTDIDKLKYVNEILMIQFKNYILREYAELELTENEYLGNSQDTNVDQISNEETFEETIREISTNEDIEMPIGHEINDSMP